MWKCWGLSLHIYGIRTLGERVVGRGHSGTLQVYLEGRFELESAQQLDTASRDQEPVLWWGLMFSCSVMSSSLRPPWTAARQASLSFTISLSLLKLMSSESVVPSNHLILCCPLLLLPSIFPSVRVFSNELALHIRWPKYWSFSFSSSSRT